MKIVFAAAFVASVSLGAACSSTPSAPTPDTSGGAQTEPDAGSPVAAPTATATASASASAAPNTSQPAAPACSPLTERCDETRPCCPGHLCARDVQTQINICYLLCTKGSDCNSGCCEPLKDNPTQGVCAPASYCADNGAECRSAGQACSTAAPCCADSVCTISGGTATCAAKCTGNAQCQSFCCAPLNNTGELVCSPPQFCTG